MFLQKCKNSKKGSTSYTGDYYKFISILSTKLIMKYALGNKMVVLLELKDFDLKLNCLYIKNFVLQLDDEIINIIQEYLKIREYILNIYDKQESKMFIKHNGEIFIKDINNPKSTPEYGAFFRIMNEIINTCSAELLSTRRILEMIDYGIDISTIAKINDCSTNKIISLQSKSHEEDDINQKLSAFYKSGIKNDEKIFINKKGFLKCPFCNKEVKAISDEWVLVQFNKDEEKHLACRKCRGENGK